MIAKLRAAGAYDVIQYGAVLKDADVYLKEQIIPYVCVLSISSELNTHLLTINLGPNIHYLLSAV